MKSFKEYCDLKEVVAQAQADPTQGLMTAINQLAMQWGNNPQISSQLKALQSQVGKMKSVMQTPQQARQQQPQQQQPQQRPQAQVQQQMPQVGTQMQQPTAMQQ
jgi:hypothetical protein